MSIKKVFYTDNGMGTGKTTRLIQYLKEKHKRSSLGANIIFLDTIDIMEQYEDRLFEEDIPFISFKNINGKTIIREWGDERLGNIDGLGVTSKLKNIVNEKRFSNIVVLTTKQALKLSKDELELLEWNLYFDENIELNESGNHRIGMQLIESILTNLGCDPIPFLEDNVLRLSIDNVNQRKLDQFIIEQREISDSNDVIIPILELIKEGYEFIINDIQRIKDGGIITLGIPQLFKIDKIVDQAKSVTFLASGFTKSFTYLYLKTKGYHLTLSNIHQTQEEGFKEGIEIIPLLDTKRFSKYLLMKDKELLPQIEERIEEITKGEPYLSHQYSWHGDVYEKVSGKPFPKNKNREVLPFHVKGMNSYTDYHICVSFVHGNVSKPQESINKIMLKWNGIDIDKGLESLRFERGMDMMAQALLRTSARLRNKQTKKNLLIVPTIHMAEELRGLLNSDNIVINRNYIISRSVKTYKEVKLTDKQQEMLERHKLCKRLHDKGYSYNQIAEELGLVSKAVVSKAINHKKSIELVEMGY